MAIDNQETADKPNNTQITGGDSQWPPWLKPLLEEKFFTLCGIHADSYKNVCNMYCLDCVNGAFCPGCLPRHKGHRVIQIRRSSHHDVIRVNVIEKLMDITGVQRYVINNANVVFLNPRPQKRPRRGVSRTCQVCPRTLVASFNFCSLACKSVGKRAMDIESEEGSYSRMSRDRVQKRKKAGSLSPAAAVDKGSRSHRRRKGIPHKAPGAEPAVE